MFLRAYRLVPKWVSVEPKTWYFMPANKLLFSSSTQVEKQEKKKKKVGRAKRRIQYNRRFVNVVAGFGKRRGPNSNAPWNAVVKWQIYFHVL